MAAGSFYDDDERVTGGGGGSKLTPTGLFKRCDATAAATNGASRRPEVIKSGWAASGKTERPSVSHTYTTRFLQC